MVFCGDMYGAYIDIDNKQFLITCINNAIPGAAYSASIFGKAVGNFTVYEVAVKNSYLRSQLFAAPFGSGQNTIDVNITGRNNYVTDTVMDLEPSNFLSDWERAQYAGWIDYSSDVKYSWVDIDFNNPDPEGNCFTGRNRGVMVDNYYNNETCNDSFTLLTGQQE